MYINITCTLVFYVLMKHTLPRTYGKDQNLYFFISAMLELGIHLHTYTYTISRYISQIFYDFTLNLTQMKKYKISSITLEIK